MAANDPRARAWPPAPPKARIPTGSALDDESMENRNGLVVDNRVTSATGTAEREAAEQMIRARAGARRVTLGTDKGYDIRAFVKQLRKLNVSAHIARKAVGSAMDRCVVAYPHYHISQTARYRMEVVPEDIIS